MSELKAELAFLAARHIAEEGLTYGQAKRKAAKQAGIAESSAAMPDNPAIEAALRAYQVEFQGDTQPAELQRLRKVALQWMNALTALPELEIPCKVLLTGAVVNGTANEFSAVHLSVYTDEDKHLEMALINSPLGRELQASQHTVGGKHYPLLVAQDTSQGHSTPIVMTLMPSRDYAAPKALSAGEFAQTATAAQLQALLAERA